MCRNEDYCRRFQVNYYKQYFRQFTSKLARLRVDMRSRRLLDSTGAFVGIFRQNESAGLLVKFD